MSKNVLIDEHASLILDCEVTISSPGTHKRARKRLYFNYFKELFIHFNGTLMIQYNNFEVKTSKLHSVFDLLYKQYTAERFAYEATHSAVSEHLSENLVYDLLLKAIAKLGLSNTDVLCHRL